MLVRFSAHPLFPHCLSVDVYHPGCSVPAAPEGSREYRIEDPAMQEWALEMQRDIRQIEERGRGRPVRLAERMVTVP